LLQSLGNGSTFTTANDAAVNVDHGSEFSHGARRKDFVGRMKLGQRDAPHLGRDFQLLGQGQDGRAGDAGETVVGVRCQEHAIVDHEQVGGIGFRHVAFGNIIVKVLDDGEPHARFVTRKNSTKTKQKHESTTTLRTFEIQHNGIGTARQIGLNFGQNVVDQVVVVYFGIHRLW